MDTSKMLTDMCQQVLSTADLKAICKSRGFSAREAASRNVFENYFLSDIGLEAALASLSREEIIVLHLLKLERRAVDIRFFECLSPPKHTWHSTFTQRYTPIFKIVQNALIRKGVLLVAVAPGTAAKMERWLFRLPQAFEPFLPPVFQTTARFPVAGSVRDAALRQSLMDILKNQRRPTKDQREHPVTLDNGQLLVGNQPFTVTALRKWQQDSWQRSVWATRWEQARQKEAKVKVMTSEDLAAKQIESKPFPPLLHYAFSQLDADEWVYWDELSTLLRLFYHGTTPPDSSAVCEIGWQLGCLAKHTAQNRDYYRWAPPPTTENEENPKRYLTSTGDATLEVNLEIIPYQSLEYLAAIADLKVVGSRLLAMPHVIKLGRASETVWQYPLIEWLRRHVAAFRKVIETVEARRGKQIIHTNLLLARVKDLTLKVALQKAFPEPGQLVLLSDDFIAFPLQLLGDIQRLLGKSGYVVKTIRAS